MIVSKISNSALAIIRDGEIHTVYSIKDAPGRNNQIIAWRNGREILTVEAPHMSEALLMLDRIENYFRELALPGADWSEKLIRLGHNSFGFLRDGEIHSTYSVMPMEADNSSWGIVHIAYGAKMVLISSPRQGEIMERFSYLLGDLRDSPTRPKSMVESWRIFSRPVKWTRALCLGGIACLALYGASALFFGHGPRAVAPAAVEGSPSLPPSVFQSMMSDQDDRSEDAIRLLQKKISDVAASRKEAGKHNSLKDGYVVTPEHPIALPDKGRVVSARPANEPAGVSLLKAPDDSPAPIAGEGETDEARTEALQKKLSILNGLDDTAPLPGSDIGNYRDMEKVLPDVSGTHH